MKKLFSVLALCLSAAAQAGPSINVGTVYDYLDSDKSTYLKRVFNGGESTAFVRINLYEITFDTEGKSVETPLDNLHDDTRTRTGLIASPARLIIPPKAMQATRLLFRGDREQERYYRVRFVPVMPEKEDNFDISESERADYKQSTSAGINILAGYGTIFFVRPQHLKFDTNVQNGSEVYQITNSGNSTIIIDDFNDCDSSNNCLPSQKHHIRPGKNFTFNKAHGHLYSFYLKEGDNSKKIEVTK
jgi:hypothetical protein